MKQLFLIFLVGILAFLKLMAGEKSVDFSNEIKPIFSDHCYACHGPDANQRKAKLRFDEEISAKAKRKKGRAIVEGKPDSSLIVKRILSEDEDEIMPPPKFKKPLSIEQIDLINRWIKEGANWENHWSFEPIEKPIPPALKADEWSLNPMDRFIFARLKEEGLDPSPEADRETLIRRASFDLTGLPPTPEEVNAFISDDSESAYEVMIDRLLASPRYGEHLARFWLDAARYGDTHGLHLDNYREMWPYRDWVVDAFNRNLSYRDFIIDQLAGDLLPNATKAQIVATGFNRCNVSTSEGGSIKEEVFVRNVIDRVVTTSTVFMGLTFECARCHDHKFDPFSMRDFYSFFAYFNSIDGEPLDGNRKEHAPILRLPSAFQTQQLEGLDAEISSLEKKIKSPWKAIDEEQKQWEIELIARLEKKDKPSDDHEFDDGESDESESENDDDEFDDDHNDHSILKLSDWHWIGPFPDARNYLLTRRHGPEGKPFQKDASFKNAADEKVFWRRRSDWKDGVVHSDLPGNVAANFIFRTIETSESQRAQISLGSDDGIKVYLNEKEILSRDVARGAAADQDFLDLELKKGRNDLLIKIANFGGATGFYFALKNGQTEVSDDILKIVRQSKKDRKPDQIDRLREFYRTQISKEPSLVEANSELKSLKEKRAETDRKVPLTLVWKERKEPRDAFVLERGEYDQRGESVSRRAPSSLPDLPKGAPENRLGLALWLTDPQHPLTARVAVNRFWQQLFGVGLVKTAEDFGSQGEAPSHPFLLDWLAADFRERDWDVKALIKTMVMSSTYRQSSKMNSELIARDPENRLLSRGPRFRLDAEMLRDQALFVSGLLVELIGGPSVKPPQPDGLWFAVGYSGSDTVRFEADKGGDKVHRRSLYTFIKRTSPPPQMSIFDGPSREACVMRRERTNTPMQALLLLNDPQFVEAARALSMRVLKESSDTDSRAKRIFLLCLGRSPSPLELDDLLKAYREERDYYSENQGMAEKLTNIKNIKDRSEDHDRQLKDHKNHKDQFEDHDDQFDQSEMAAWMSLASLLLNLDEVLTKN